MNQFENDCINTDPIGELPLDEGPVYHDDGTLGGQNGLIKWITSLFKKKKP